MAHFARKYGEYSKNRAVAKPDATITVTTKAPFNSVVAGFAKFDDQVKAGNIKVSGDASKMNELLAMLDNFEYMFNIVTP